MRASAVLMLVGVLVASRMAQPDFSGEWSLALATTNRTRDGAVGEQPTRTYLSEGAAFNCGRGCRILHKGSTLMVENAQLNHGARAPGPTVSIAIDGQLHTVIDSVTLGNTIETVGRWEEDKLLLTSMLGGRPISQTISLEENQLVVVRSFATSPGTKFTLRYARK